MRRLVFAANWKMHLAPDEARDYMATFLAAHRTVPDREVWFFPPAIALETVAAVVRGRADLRTGIQNVHWEPKGAFTGAVSAPMAARAGATAALVGHSERRHVFGETDQDTGRKVAAVLQAGLTPVLCVGEKLEERDGGETVAVVTRQLGAGLAAVTGDQLGEVLIAYEPVWAIGTGRNAQPQDAAAVHREIRAWLIARGARRATILYGGSVNLQNVAALLAESELDGVLVGGASLDPDGWARLVQTGAA